MAAVFDPCSGSDEPQESVTECEQYVERISRHLVIKTGSRAENDMSAAMQSVNGI